MAARSQNACVKAADASPTCVRDVIGRLGRRALRRPISAEEKEELAALYEAERARAGARTGVIAIVRALFLSPSFLYRAERGDGPAGDEKVTLTSHEIAQSRRTG